MWNPFLLLADKGRSLFFKACVAIAALYCFSQCGDRVLAEDPEIRAAVSGEEIFIGESIDYQIEIRNAENPVAPDITPLREQFDVVFNGDQSRNQSSTFILNGRISQQSVLSHLYLYRLTPKIAGDLTIPSVKATVDGIELVSNEIQLRVQDAETQDLVLVEVKVSHATVYPTQPFTVTARILVQPLPDSDANPLTPLRRRPPHLQISWAEAPDGLTTGETSEWLQPLLAQNEIGFTLNEFSASTGSFFGGSRAAVFDLARGREVRNGLDGKPIEYFVYELSRSFTPQKTGNFSFGPAVVKGTFADGARGNEYTARRLVAIASTASVEVREVPSPRPATFTGGIGDYEVAASASPVKLRVGDPLTLTLEFAGSAGSGSLELISAPDLAAISEIADGFEIIDRNPTGRVEGGIKKFSYAMRPKRTGVSIPAMTLTTFDPAKETFTEIATEAISLEVGEASSVSSGDLVGAIAGTGNSEIRRSDQGIFQNITDPAELFDQRVSTAGWLAAVVGAWGVAIIAAVGVTIYRRRSSDTIWQRRQQARRMAHSKLTMASQLYSQGQSKASLHHVRAAIIGLVADLKNRVSEGLTSADVAEAVTAAGVPEDDRRMLLGLLESIESAEYGAGDSINPTTAVQTASALIDRVSPVLERSAR